MSRIVLLHPAGVEPSDFAKLVGPLPFDCVYPRAANGSRWAHLGDSPDVAALMGIEAQFICGYSSGGFMALRMCVEKQYRGCMVVAAGLVKYWAPKPTPLMVCHGTADERVPYSGSQDVLGALDTAQAMKKLLMLKGRGTITDLNTADDGCGAFLETWGRPPRVKLYAVVNGGHTYPTGPRTVYQPPELGRVCRDFDASVALSEFFRSLQ